jgi:hypothetical protein
MVLTALLFLSSRATRRFHVQPFLLFPLLAGKVITLEQKSLLFTGLRSLSRVLSRGGSVNFLKRGGGGQVVTDSLNSATFLPENVLEGFHFRRGNNGLHCDTKTVSDRSSPGIHCEIGTGIYPQKTGL